jgi:predicted MFS family arabinose efflux permease
VTSTTDRATTTRFPWPATLVPASAGLLTRTVELSPAALLTRTAPDLNASVAMTGSLTALHSPGNAILTLPMTLPAVRFSRRFSPTATLLVPVADNALVFFASDLVPTLASRFTAGGAHRPLTSLAPAVAVSAATPHADQLVTIIRDPAKAADLTERGVTVRQADYGNPPALHAALEGWSGSC